MYAYVHDCYILPNSFDKIHFAALIYLSDLLMKQKQLKKNCTPDTIAYLEAQNPEKRSGEPGNF